MLEANGGTYRYFPNIDIMIDLDGEKKGVHMSRLVESMNEVVSKRVRQTRKSFEEVGVEILKALRKRHSFRRAEVRIMTTMFVERRTPVTNSQTNEPYDVTVGVVWEDDKFSKRLEAKAIGSTLCPHSLNMTGGKSHVQRAELRVAVNTELDTDLPLETLIEICEGSFSAPTYTVLKSLDEASLVERMYTNPKFVEDVVRDCYARLQKENVTGRAWIKAVAFESIHKHNAVSEMERDLQRDPI